MEVWYKIVTKSSFFSFDEVQKVFGSADYVAPYTVLNIGGNNFRLVSSIHYNRQKIYIRFVLTHAEYDRWIKEYRRKKDK